MKKILNYIPKWLLLTLIYIIYLTFWWLILIVVGSTWLFSKKSTDSEKIMGGKMVIITVIVLVTVGIFAEYQNAIENFLDFAAKIIIPIAIIGAIIYAIKDKFFTKKCPKCESVEILKIEYGEPTQEAFENSPGIYFAGCCCFDEGNYEWVCRKCHWEWGKKVDGQYCEDEYTDEEWEKM